MVWVSAGPEAAEHHRTRRIRCPRDGPRSRMGSLRAWRWIHPGSPISKSLMTSSALTRARRRTLYTIERVSPEKVMVSTPKGIALAHEVVLTRPGTSEDSSTTTIRPFEPASGSIVTQVGDASSWLPRSLHHGLRRKAA